MQLSGHYKVNPWQTEFCSLHLVTLGLLLRIIHCHIEQCCCVSALASLICSSRGEITLLFHQGLCPNVVCCNQLPAELSVYLLSSGYNLYWKFQVQVKWALGFISRVALGCWWCVCFTIDLGWYLWNKKCIANCCILCKLAEEAKIIKTEISQKNFKLIICIYSYKTDSAMHWHLSLNYTSYSYIIIHDIIHHWCSNMLKL